MPLMEDNTPYIGPATIREFDTLLFDMDGTIIDSTAAIVKHWHQIGQEIGIDGQVILQTSHGRRSIDVLSILKPELANWDFVCSREGQIPKQFGADAVEIPGSRALLDQLSAAGASWGIVTSGTRPLVDGWLDRMNLAHPRTMVTAEDVSRGKPDPACYRLGALKVAATFNRPQSDPDRTVVFEDAPAGIKAGKAAGFWVIALATTHNIADLMEAGADWIVKDARSLTLATYKRDIGRAGIRINHSVAAPPLPCEPWINSN